MLIIRPHKARVCIAFQWGHDFAASGFPTRPLFSLDAFIDAFAKTNHHSADGLFLGSTGALRKPIIGRPLYIALSL
ncbi:hypothetical protein C8J56DRAFT_1052138 [Mycena floridula]|nr:hypothetical protein C8J56DRAFT_1052138 [Mycena floridula]